MRRVTVWFLLPVRDSGGRTLHGGGAISDASIRKRWLMDVRRDFGPYLGVRLTLNQVRFKQ